MQSGICGVGRVWCVTQSVGDITAMKITVLCKSYSYKKPDSGPILGLLRKHFMWLEEGAQKKGKLKKVLALRKKLIPALGPQ